MEQKNLLPKNKFENNEYYEDHWSDEGSSVSSYYSDTESSEAEWESSVTSNGELLFIDCDPIVFHSNLEHSVDETPQDFKANLSIRRSTRSKFLRLLRRRDSKRYSKRSKSNISNISNQDVGSSKVKFQDYQEGEIREVLLKIDHEQRTLGRRATLVESLLGITISPLSDGNRVMIAGFIPDSEAAKQKYIKIGDWLKCINNIEVNFTNVNFVLEEFINSTEVILRLQRVAGVEVTQHPPINELSNQSNFVRQLLNFQSEEQSVISTILCEQPVGIVFINTASLTEGGLEFEGVVYCFPNPREKNSLCTSRGIFITLNHLLAQITNSRPQTTSFTIGKRLVHVTYKNFNRHLLLFMLPDTRANVKEIGWICNDLIRMFQFMYQSVEDCFNNLSNHKQLDHFFHCLFMRILSNRGWSNIIQSIDISKLKNKTIEQTSKQFENIVAAVHMINLPEEAQIEIDNALTELEASDYREWNEEPLDCQRLFTILGSALYHSGYLLKSHLVHNDLIEINSFCNFHDFFYLSRTEPVRTLVLWREVFPASCNSNFYSEGSLYTAAPDGRRYLLIVGAGKDLLAVLMEAGGCTEPSIDNMGPDPFYVEEAQATLAHLQDIGVSNLAEQWITCMKNPGEQVVMPEIPNKRKSDFLLANLGLLKSTVIAKETLISTHNQKKNYKNEVTSILKRRISDPIAGSLYSFGDDSYSEDSISQQSEVSDEPVLGRKAIRERKTYMAGSDEEESDAEDYQEGSFSSSSYDLSELHQALLSENADSKLTPLTTGPENVLFHYVELDLVEGILLCPTESHVHSGLLEIILNNFRSAAQDIHNLFQNTLRFKCMLAQDKTKAVVNKSLIAIKEYGVLFECAYEDDASKKFGKLSYWVTGRLFSMPHTREMFVCYQDTIPQNIVDIAFKLGIANN